MDSWPDGGRFRLLVAAPFSLSSLPSTAWRSTGNPFRSGRRSRHVGQRETVCGTIAGEHTAYRSRRTPTFINLDQPYPHQVFTILIWGDQRAEVGRFPGTGKVCVTGAIRKYRSVPEVVLRDAGSWSVAQ